MNDEWKDKLAEETERILEGIEVNSEAIKEDRENLEAHSDSIKKLDERMDKQEELLEELSSKMKFLMKDSSGSSFQKKQARDDIQKKLDEVRKFETGIQ